MSRLLATAFIVLSALLALGCSQPTDGGDGPGDALSFDGSLPSDFGLTIGRYWPPGGDFTPLEPGLELEIVQGIQGGVHTEISLELDLGVSMANTPIVHFDLRVQTLLDGEEVVADLELTGFKAGNIGLGVFRTQTLPVIFEQNEAVFYEGRDALLVAQVTINADAASGATASVHLVDTRNDLDDLDL